MKNDVRYSWMITLRHKDYLCWWLSRLLVFYHSDSMHPTYEWLMDSRTNHAYAAKVRKAWDSKRYGMPEEWIVKGVSKETLQPTDYPSLPLEGIFIKQSDRDMRPDEPNNQLNYWDEDDGITQYIGSTTLQRKDNPDSRPIIRHWIITDPNNATDAELTPLIAPLVTKNWDYYRYGALSNYRIVSHSFGVAKPTQPKTIRVH